MEFDVAVIMFECGGEVSDCIGNVVEPLVGECRSAVDINVVSMLTQEFIAGGENRAVVAGEFCFLNDLIAERRVGRVLSSDCF